MPKYAIERQYLLPIYAQDIVEAPDLATAITLAMDLSWDHEKHDYDSATPTFISRAVEVPADYTGYAPHALYNAGLPPLDLPTEFAGGDDPRRAVATLDAIHNTMDGAEWDADTLSEIAGLLREHGYTIREPEDAEC